MALKAGQVLEARACRIGFKDSETVKFKLGDSITPAKQAETEFIPHWSERFGQTDLLNNLRTIKEFDGLGKQVIPRYMEALWNEYDSVRYWAVTGLHYSCEEKEDVQRAKRVLTMMLKDPAPVVRIAVAHALCDWGQEEEALPVLAEALKSETDKARLYAIIALKSIGRKAQPLLSEIKAALEDKDNYVQRVARATLKQLEK